MALERIEPGVLLKHLCTYMCVCVGGGADSANTQRRELGGGGGARICAGEN